MAVVGAGVFVEQPMTFLMHWQFKTGYHEQAARRFMSTGAPMPEGCGSWTRYHAPGSVEGWIIVDTADAGVCYEHAAEWAEYLNWTVTPVFPDEQAGALISKVYT
jgi:hypothetical protein|tara:strand:+ start:703 stop:1017 length:315 start_codon:yes stop_codon:yes gene_type:complete